MTYCYGVCPLVQQVPSSPQFRLFTLSPNCCPGPVLLGNGSTGVSGPLADSMPGPPAAIRIRCYLAVLGKEASGDGVAPAGYGFRG